MLIDPNAQPYLKSLTACLTKVAEEGFTENFRLEQEVLEAASSGTSYAPHVFEVINCFRFKGMGQAQEEIILLILQAPDGIKGTFMITEQNRMQVPLQLGLRCERKAH